MLRDLLRCIAANPGQSSRELAECLAARGFQVEKGFVEMAIRELEQKGFLRQEPQEACGSASNSGGGSSACAHCPLQCAGRQASTWVLTEKARAVRQTAR
jgi:hypothetical protein